MYYDITTSRPTYCFIPPVKYYYLSPDPKDDRRAKGKRTNGGARTNQKDVVGSGVSKVNYNFPEQPLGS